ncbi:hypothetical protein ACIREM_13695 [Streptomyces shenzhenensis]|uniref:hypothetical protein n=1 Tax=Streptomyces shenzhenensis TaxID=943815 RepID=UPI003809AAB6
MPQVIGPPREIQRVLVNGEYSFSGAVPRDVVRGEIDVVVCCVLEGRADGTGIIPWTEGFATAEQTGRMVERVRTACQVVIALLTGLRTSELAAMPLDPCVPPQNLGAGRTRYRLRTELIKGQKQLGGVWDEWVTVAPAYDAVALAINLLAPSKHVFGRTTMAKR